MSPKRLKKFNALLRASSTPPTLPSNLAYLVREKSVLTWFDSGREFRGGRAVRFTASWKYYAGPGVVLNREAFLLKASGFSSPMDRPPDASLLDRAGRELRPFEPKLPATPGCENVPVYVTDLIAAWYALAGLRLSDYPENVDMLSDGKNAIDVMLGVALPRYLLSERNLGLELKAALERLSDGKVRWHFVPKKWTRFLDASQRHHKLTLRLMEDRTPRGG